MEKPEYDKRLKKVLRNSNFIKKSRAEIIEETIDIEFLLDQIILEYLNLEDDKKEFFLINILHKESFTLNRKIRLFTKLGFHKKEEFTGLIGKLEYIRKMRNSAAHDVTSTIRGKPELVYKFRDEKTTVLDMKEMKKFRESCKFVSDALKKILFRDLLKWL